MRLLTTAGACAVILAVFSCPAAARGEPDFDYVIVGNEARVILPPELVCGPGVEDQQWSEDGRFLLMDHRDSLLSEKQWKDLLLGKAAEEDLVAPCSLIVWDRTTRRSRVAWSSGDKFADVTSFRWLTGGDAAVASVIFAEQAPEHVTGTCYLVSIDASSARSKVLLELPSGQFGDILYSAKSPAAIFRAIEPRGDDVLETLYVVKVNGQLGPVVQAPPEATLDRLECSADESCAYLYFRSRAAGAVSAYSLDAATGSLAPIDASAPVYAQRPVPRNVTIDNKPLPIPGKPGTLVHLFWLQGSDNAKGRKVLVAAGADIAEMSPREDAVYYVSDGTAWVRPILRMQYAEVADLLTTREISERLMLAKEIGLGIIMFSADNEDRLPRKADDLAAALTQYVQDPAMLSGFVYNLQGGSLSDIEKPAETEMGYIPYENGRAVLYADGHCVWVPGSR